MQRSNQTATCQSSRIIKQTRCRCGASLHTSSPPEEAHWGLPTPGCSSVPMHRWTAFLVNEYPAAHRRWRSQGRVLVHCTSSAGLGDYLRGLPAVMVLSILTELALTLHCDMPMMDSGRPAPVPGHLPHYFQGPHFNWAWPSPRRPNATIELEGKQMRSWSAWPRDEAVRVISTGSTHARRILKFNSRWAERRFGPEFIRQINGTPAPVPIAPLPHGPNAPSHSLRGAPRTLPLGVPRSKPRRLRLPLPARSY